jgi:hypothetical protein
MKRAMWCVIISLLIGTVLPAVGMRPGVPFTRFSTGLAGQGLWEWNPNSDLWPGFPDAPRTVSQNACDDHERVLARTVVPEQPSAWIINTQFLIGLDAGHAAQIENRLVRIRDHQETVIDVASLYHSDVGFAMPDAGQQNIYHRLGIDAGNVTEVRTADRLELRSRCAIIGPRRLEPSNCADTHGPIPCTSSLLLYGVSFTDPLVSTPVVWPSAAREEIGPLILTCGSSARIAWQPTMRYVHRITQSLWTSAGVVQPFTWSRGTDGQWLAAATAENYQATGGRLRYTTDFHPDVLVLSVERQIEVTAFDAGCTLPNVPWLMMLSFH